MDNLNNKISGFWLAVIYKLLHDTIFLLLVIFAFLLVIEGTIPGFISEHLNMTKLAIVTFAVPGIIIYLNKKLKINYGAERKIGKKWIIFLAIFSILLIINSLLRFDWEDIIIIVIAISLIFFYFYKDIFS